MENIKDEPNQNNGYIVDDDGKLAKVIDGDRYSQHCPFSEGTVSDIEPRGESVGSHIPNKAECGDWCALFEHRPLHQTGNIEHGNEVTLHCSTRTIKLVNQIP